MLPITINVELIKIVVVGTGYATERRIAELREAGAKNIKIFPTPPAEHEYDNAVIVLVAGFNEKESSQIAKIVRNKGILLNIEDKKQHCDFHMPAVARRGDLSIAISTSGKSPYIAGMIRKQLENLYGEEWSEIIQEIGYKREKWIEQGIRGKELCQKTEAFLKILDTDTSTKH